MKEVIHRLEAILADSHLFVERKFECKKDMFYTYRNNWKKSKIEK
jgi:hypothetical protein